MAKRKSEEADDNKKTVSAKSSKTQAPRLKKNSIDKDRSDDSDEESAEESGRSASKPATLAKAPKLRAPVKAAAVPAPVKVDKGPEATAPTPPPPVNQHTIEQKPSAYVDRGLPVPDNYGMDRLVALVRDPAWVFTYWELHGERMPQLKAQRGQSFIDSCAWVLRLYRIDEGSAMDAEIAPYVGNWYINVGRPGRYQFELGLLSPDGEWISLLASYTIETPLNHPSPVIDERWRMRPEDEDALTAFLRKSAAADANRGGSGFLGASRLQSSFAMAISGISSLGSSASGRPVAGSWAMSFQGASGRVNSSGSGGFGWIVSPAGDHEPLLERPSNVGGGPNWNWQPDLPRNDIGKTNQPNFKIKLPRILHGINPPTPTWPPAERNPRFVRLEKAKA